MKSTHQKRNTHHRTNPLRRKHSLHHFFSDLDVRTSTKLLNSEGRYEEDQDDMQDLSVESPTAVYQWTHHIKTASVELECCVVCIGTLWTFIFLLVNFTSLKHKISKYKRLSPKLVLLISICDKTRSRVKFSEMSLVTVKRIKLYSNLHYSVYIQRQRILVFAQKLLCNNHCDVKCDQNDTVKSRAYKINPKHTQITYKKCFRHHFTPHKSLQILLLILTNCR